MIRTKWVVAAVIVFALPSGSMGQDWRHFVGEHGIHKVLTAASGDTPDGPATTTLTLACRPEGGKGGIFVSYGLRDAHKMKSFDLIYFQGPDAPAQHKRLVTLSIQTKRAKSIFKRRASGEYSNMDNSDDFQFEMGRAPRRLIDLLLKGAET